MATRDFDLVRGGEFASPFGAEVGLVLAFRERARTPLPFEGLASMFNFENPSHRARHGACHEIQDRG
jgi:hypothetical protein